MYTHAVPKRLGKNPEDYPDAKSQPHVQVAIRNESQRRNPRAGDVIPYVFCLGPVVKPARLHRPKEPNILMKLGKPKIILRLVFHFYFIKFSLGLGPTVLCRL